MNAEYDKGYQNGYDAGYKRAMLDYGLEDDCEDCVSISDVVKVLTNNGVHFGDMVKITSEFKALPPVTPKPRWIPVSERLPEIEEDCDVSDMVFATVEDRCNPQHNLYRYVIYADWDGELWRDENGHEFLNIMDGEDIGVTAWMPQPEPYKEGESE